MCRPKATQRQLALLGREVAVAVQVEERSLVRGAKEACQQKFEEARSRGKRAQRERTLVTPGARDTPNESMHRRV